MKLLTNLFSFWLGGVTLFGSYYAVWLATNPACSVNSWTIKYMLLWPWYRAIDIIAWCV